ncbi:hypothetical protein AAT19DRAFT_16312 [Rhodotorula toruloides]|uniref:Uncharacterized protein n=1 Tax=Rhodotorula toruloides TaxID=5286 RepID=A0A2T0A2Z3_RHOTO|nr:hypothetical protein AAT19DRAFT_16312 [Rhodotorula toruloides]
MRTGISSTTASWALRTSITMADTPTIDPAPSNPAEPASSSSTVAQPPPPGEAVTEGGGQGGVAAGQVEGDATESTEQTGETAEPAAPLDAATTASPLPPPPSHSGSATPAPPIVVEPVPAPSASTPQPPAASATQSPSPEPDKFSVPYSDAYRAAQSASRWNGLLSWARGIRLESSPGGAERGWDFATGMCVRSCPPLSPSLRVAAAHLADVARYHVPRNSPSYTAGVERTPMSVPSLLFLPPDSLFLPQRPLPSPTASLPSPSLSPSPTQPRRFVRRRRDGFGGWKRVS